MSQRAERAIDAANAANTAHDYDYLTSEMDVDDEMPEAMPPTQNALKHSCGTLISKRDFFLECSRWFLYFVVVCQSNTIGVIGRGSVSLRRT
jgi:hypothetical protein